MSLRDRLLGIWRLLVAKGVTPEALTAAKDDLRKAVTESLPVFQRIGGNSQFVWFVGDGGTVLGRGR